ncbi:MAG: gliding motility-associated C-terminal domain-containing protein [Saprospirales bacterium]|nr:gliding motility-associated C-terminal domain-containing protein [Saprospirales bacterium]
MKWQPAIPAACLLATVQMALAQSQLCPSTGPNLIANGNFELGYYGFTSDFGRGLNNATKGGCGTQGWFVVAQADPHADWSCQLYPQAYSAQFGGPNTETDPNPAHPGNTAVITLATCNHPLPDHTTGAGYFLAIDPDAIAGRAYWKQKVTVCPNTDYVFSVWVRNISPGCGLPAPFFHFEVGGVPINTPTSYPACSWVQTDALWNSGNVQGEVWIQLVNDQPGCIANDVAIDDLFFGICGGTVLTGNDRYAFCGESAGMPFVLSGQATGFSPPQYQWQKFDPSKARWVDIAGATDSVYLIAAPGPDAAGYYRLLAAANGNNHSAHCATASAAIRIDAFPEYATQVAADICPGETYAGYPAAGTYVDTFLSVAGCDSIRTLFLRLRETYRVETKNTLCRGSTFDFNGRRLSAPGLYVDTLASLYGCDSIVALELELLPRRFLDNDTSFCYVPNAFSPNDDGVNDLFVPYFADIDFKTYEFRIFDRWGSLLFATRDPAAGWNGKHRGRNCAGGVYTYFMLIETGDCANLTFEGTISLIK